MKKQENFYRSIGGVALVTMLVLMVPLVAMQFTEEVNWGVVDFIIVAALIFSTGVLYKLVTRSASGIVYRIAAGLGLGATLLMIWANLGVGLIGSGPNAGNLMYIGVLVVCIFSTLRSRFTAAGMELAMYVTALALVLHAVIALLAGMHHYPGSSVEEIVSVNGFFAVLFIASGLLFHYAKTDAVQATGEKSRV